MTKEDVRFLIMAFIMKLVVVESPTKCHTIGSYLGSNYKVVATNGHFRDLTTRSYDNLGIDIKKDFKPFYEVTKPQIVKELIAEKKKADEVILATDPDREGEAIAWHVSQILKIDPKVTKRMEFHEITRDSIGKAIESPRTIDLNLVASQETRRIIDRIIGFDLTKLVKAKLKQKSAGRVQTATLKLVYDHEKKIESFVPEEYWTIDIDIDIDKKIIKIPLYRISGEKYKLENQEQAMVVCEKLTNNFITLVNIKDSIRKIESKPAFTTSTLQQEAFNVYHFPTSLTSSLAQRLFEGVKINGELVGLITYIRTDSTALSDSYVNRAHNYINETYGEEYFAGRKVAKKGFLAQSAHEAIRPTSNHRTPEFVRPFLLNYRGKGNDNESIGEMLYKLYKLIYDRALGSVMSAKKESVRTYLFECDEYSFKVENSHVVFDGFSVLKKSESKEDEDIFSHLILGNKLSIQKVNPEQKWTEPPARLTEAKLVKLMEEKGIGRPSTYSSTIKTLLDRPYIREEKGLIYITQEGTINAAVLNKYFPDMVDAKYTAELESQLDEIQNGEISRLDVLQDFYDDFMKKYQVANELIYKSEPIKVGRNCPRCGKPLIIKQGKNHKDFIGCSGFPECHYVEYEKPTEVEGETCPLCHRPLLYRKTSDGKRTFIACSGYPVCKYSRNLDEKLEPTIYEKSNCPKCGGKLYLKNGPYGPYVECENYKECGYRNSLKKKFRRYKRKA